MSDRSPADDLRALWTGVRTTNAEGVCLTCHRGWGEHRDSCEVGRLDAALSQPEPPEPSGGEAAASDVEGAVAEALAVEAALSQAVSRAGKLTALLAGIANRATPSPSPAELDVETLARAMHKVGICHDRRAPGATAHGLSWPEKVAAEYAALRRTQQEGLTPPVNPLSSAASGDQDRLEKETK